jgi:hypothetical protein
LVIFSFASSLKVDQIASPATENPGILPKSNPTLAVFTANFAAVSTLLQYL